MEENTNIVVTKEEAYVDSIERSIIGFASGFVGYNFVYSYIIALIIQVVVIYSNVNANGNVLNMILMLLTGVVTLILGIVIAKPNRLKKAYSKVNFDQVKLLIKTLVIMIVVTMGYNLIINLLGVDVGGGNTNQESVVESIVGAPILAFITFVLVAPISEEITYRYFLFGGIRKMSPKWAVIISGFVFMVVHGLAGFFSGSADILKELILLPPYMFSGCMLAYSYNKSSNLSVSTGVHILNNLLSFILSII